MFSDCSMPALKRKRPVSKPRRESSRERRWDAQGLWLRSERGALVLRRRVEALHEPHAQEEDIPAAERHALLLRAREDVREGDRVRRERVVREPSPVRSLVEAHEVEEDAAPANAMLRPVCRMRLE